MKGLPDILIKLAAVLVVIAVIYKFVGIIAVAGGYGAHYAGPLGISPDAFLQFSAILLLFSIAVNVGRMVSGKSGSAAQ